MKKIFTLLFVFTFTFSAQAEEAAGGLENLLLRVERGAAADAAAEAARLQKFIDNKNTRQAALTKIKAQIASAEARSIRLEARHRENETNLAALQARLDERLGELGALFGELRLAAGRLAGGYATSLAAASVAPATREQHAASLEKLAAAKKLPAIEELESFWHALHQRITAQGQVQMFAAPLASDDGSSATRDIVRLGDFIALSQGAILRYKGAGLFATPPRQPPSRFVSVGEDLFEGVEDNRNEEPLLAVIDPTRGALLDVLVHLPSLGERLAAGGIIGAIIILLGLAGAALVGWRLWELHKVNAGIAIPLAHLDSIAANNKTKERLEAALDEALLENEAGLQKHLSLIKVLAALAPLLGLLGTVTGMILTFEVIARFGTGDPKLMADGISQALMTTVLGLLVAIPLLALHAIALARATALFTRLELAAVALLATSKEQ